MNNTENSTPLVETYLTLPESIFSDFSDSSDPSGSNKVLCKFVILKAQGRLVLLWGAVAEFPYHANLVEKYCDRHDIPCSWTNRPTLLELFDSDIKIRGGGYAEIQTDGKKIVFGGRSTAYGKFVRSDLDAILSENHLWDRFSYSIQ